MLTRRARPPAMVSVVPMIDVLLILLVFFMVTSSYLNLDMIPASASRDAGASGGEPASTVLVRLGADGGVHLQGKSMSAAELGTVVAARAAQEPALRVLVLPSPRASLQTMVQVMDIATVSGAASVSFLRLEARGQ